MSAGYTNRFFELVPENLKEDNANVSSPKLDEFCERAGNDGFPQDVINKARKRSGTAATYEEFVDIISDILDDEDRAESMEIKKKQTIQRSIEREINRLQTVDIMDAIDKQIKAVYNTSCVTSLELVELCSETFDSKKEELYQKCEYAVYLCMKSVWVRDALQQLMDLWDSSMEIKEYISVYMKKHGATDENMNAQIRRLPNYLPDEYKNETAPLMYKAYKAVVLLSTKNNPSNELETAVLATNSYYKSLMASHNVNVPLIAACTIATRASLPELEVKAPYGYTVMLPYATARTYDEAFSQSLGYREQEFYTTLMEDEEDAKEERLEEEIKEVQEKTKAKVVVNQSPRQPSKVLVRKKQPQKVDIAPYIPIWFAATFIHIVICLILFIFTKFFALLSLLCLGAASVGWIAKDRGTDVGGKSPYLYIAGGYIGFVLCLILFLS